MIKLRFPTTKTNPDDKATLWEIAESSAATRIDREAIVGALFRTFWTLEEKKVEWWHDLDLSHDNTLGRRPRPRPIDRIVMMRIARGGSADTFPWPDNETKAIGDLAKLEYQDYIRDFRSKFIHTLMCSRESFESTVLPIAARLLSDHVRNEISKAGRELATEKHAEENARYADPVDEAKKIWKSGDDRDHIKMRDFLIRKDEYQDLEKDKLKNKLVEAAREIDKPWLVYGTPEHRDRGKRS